MFNLMQEGLGAQKMINDANKSADIKRGKCEKHGEFSLRYRSYCDKCFPGDDSENGEKSQADDDALELYLFDRTEAQAVNRSR
jgi:hypothetical protein